MDKTKALEFWKLEMNDKPYGYDFAGRKVKREDYGLKNSVGWVIGHLRPVEHGGVSEINNIKIMHHTTLEEKGINYPEFMILHKKYIVKFDQKENYYYIEKLSNDEYNDEGFF